MHYLKRWAVLVFAALLAACGGGGDVGGSSSSGSTTSSAATVEVLASALTLNSADNTTGITISARVKDASNNSLTSTAVSFSSDSGVLSGVSATTNSSTGVATATLMPGSNRANRSITVTVTSGSVSGKVVVAVTGTTLTLTGSSSLLTGTTAPFTATLTDSSGSTISGTVLTVTSSIGNAVSKSSLTTGTTSSGADQFTYTANASGTDTLTVSGAGTSATYAVAISGSDFTFVAPSDNAIVTTGTSPTVSVLYKNSSGVAQAGVTVNFSSTRGSVTTASATTNGSGIASTTFSSTTAGPATLTAQLSGGAAITRAITFVGGTPATVVLQPSSTAVTPNAAGSNANSVTLTATVKDTNGNVVSGSVVNFSLVQDTSGGTIGSASGTTNSNGIATSTFVPGATTTASNGVVVKATVSGTTISATTTLTVSGKALAITIGTGNSIAVLDSTKYSAPFTVTVNDANGIAVANQSVVLSIFPTYYYKGTLTFNGTLGYWAYTNLVATKCANEDVNKNGILDAGEDTNTNGVLTPGAPASLDASPVVTGASGFVNFNLIYPKNFAFWVTYQITATATVAGTESSYTFTYDLPGVSSDYTDSSVSPPGQTSPFGSATLCTNKN